MPEESTTPNVEEALRRNIEAVTRRDFDSAMSLYTSDAVWDMSQGGLGVFEGRDAIRGFFEDWTGAFQDFEQVIEEFCELGSGVTFGVVHMRGRPASGSGSVEFRYAGVTSWRGGLIETATAYTDIDEARATAERLAEERG